MKYNKLGKSNLLVSEIGLGCMSLPIDDLKQSVHIVRDAFDFGINYFDTADLYDRGANEELLGKAISGFRQEIVLATKVGNQWQNGVSGWTWNPSRNHILQAVEQSLKRLGTDYIDLYQLHGGTDADDFEEIVDTFELLIQQGKIRSYGLSSIRPNVFMQYLRSSKIASNMMQYSALDSRPEEYLKEFTRHEVSVIARGSMAQGLLLDKEISQPYLQHTSEDTEIIKRSIAEVAAELDISKQAVALKYILAQSAVASAVVGVRTIEQLEKLRNACLQLENVSSECVCRLSERLPKVHYQDHLI